MLVFHLETHPNYTCYTQCITFNIFPSYVHEVSYTLFGMLIMYWFPLAVIFYTYSSIFMEICRRSKEKSEGTTDSDLSRYIRDLFENIFYIHAYSLHIHIRTILHYISYFIRIKSFRVSCYLMLGNKVKRLINRHSLADKIRRSSSGFLSRARVRTLKMTITIIAVFIICWSPYYVMSVWWVTTIFQFPQNTKSAKST